MSALDLRNLLKGLFAAHASPSSGVLPAVSATDWDQHCKKYATFVKPIADAAAGTTYEWPFFYNSGASTLTVTAIKLVPFAALTADSTNYKTVAVNRRLAADSATVVGSVNTKLSGAGGTGEWVALTPITITLSSTAADLVVAAGEGLSLHLVHSGSGVAVPVCAVTVEYLETS